MLTTECKSSERGGKAGSKIISNHLFIPFNYQGVISAYNSEKVDADKLGSRQRKMPEPKPA